jgi:hypothetical protein
MMRFTKTIAAMMLMVAIVCVAGCGSNKPATTSNPPTDNNPFGTFYDLPCVDASYDDDDYFRGLGIGTHVNMQSARTAAIDAAQSMLQKRLGGFVQGLTTDYSRTVSGQAPADKVQRLMEGEMDKIVERMVNDAQKTCEKFSQLKTGEYQSYIAIQIPKKSMMDEMINALAENEELEIEFNRERFRKFTKERMEEMRKNQNNTNN